MKKKAEGKFLIVHRGYKRDQVDKYLSDLVAENEKIHSEQRDRILALTEEIKSLKAAVKECKDREGQISSAIVSATDKGEKMMAEMRMRYAMELERLNLFRAKWTGVYQELKERYGFDGDALNLESVAVSTRLEIERFLSRDFSLSKGDEQSAPEEDFRRELERLSSISGASELKDKLLEVMKTKSVASHVDA